MVEDTVMTVYVYELGTGVILERHSPTDLIPWAENQHVGYTYPDAVNISEVDTPPANIEVIKALEATDEGMIRVIEDLVDHIVDGTPLSSFALAKVAARKALRAELE